MSSLSGATYYRAYGLTIESELRFPELAAIPETTPDVTVRYGTVPERLDKPTITGLKFQATVDQVLIRTYRIAKILVSRGETALIQPRSGSREGDVRSLMLGWGLGALLHQRNILPLHASAISLGDDCIAFCAPSGTGKSSIAQIFVQRGYPLLDDNVVAVDFVDGEPRVHPGSQVIKLPGEVLEKAGHSFPPPGSYLPALGKYAMNARQGLSNHSQPLKRIYVLTRGETKADILMPMTGARKFDCLMKNVFCLRFVRGTERLSRQFRMVESITARMPVMEVSLPDWPTPYDRAADLIERDFSQHGRQPENQPGDKAFQ